MAPLFADLCAVGLLPASELVTLADTCEGLLLKVRTGRLCSRELRELDLYAQHFFQCVLARRAELAAFGGSECSVPVNMLLERWPTSHMSADMNEMATASLRSSLLRGTSAGAALGVREVVKQVNSLAPLSVRACLADPNAVPAQVATQAARGPNAPYTGVHGQVQANRLAHDCQLSGGAHYLCTQYALDVQGEISGRVGLMLWVDSLQETHSSASRVRSCTA